MCFPDSSKEDFPVKFPEKAKKDSKKDSKLLTAVSSSSPQCTTWGVFYPWDSNLDSSDLSQDLWSSCKGQMKYLPITGSGH